MIFFVCKAQNSDSIFSTSKGTWRFPIDNVVEIDTMTHDCLGIPTNSHHLILRTDWPMEVKALQSGTVAAVKIFDGICTLIVQAEDYFLVYQGLDDVKLRKGDDVEQGCLIGKLTKWEDKKKYELVLMLLKSLRTLNINRWFDWKTAYNKELSTMQAEE